MKSLADNLRLQYTEHDQPELLITLKLTRREAQEAAGALKEVLARGKLLAMEVKPYRAKRSLDANAMLWSILSEMAAALSTTKDELYLEVLERYGVFTHIVVKPEMVDRVMREWRTVRSLGEVTVNGKTGVQLQCYFGSSTYNTKEFSVLLEGVIQDARDLGIDVITESEKQLLLSEWGEKEGK